MARASVPMFIFTFIYTFIDGGDSALTNSSLLPLLPPSHSFAYPMNGLKYLTT